MMLQ